MAFSPTAKWLAATGSVVGDGQNIRSVWLWDVDTQKEVEVLAPLRGSSVAFSPDGKWLAVGRSSTVQLWEVNLPALSVHPQGKLPTTLGEIKTRK